MGGPEFVIRAKDLSPDGVLTDADRRRVRAVLQNRGFVLLPSDTAYSVAAIPFDADTRLHINLLLARPDIPISLAFPTVAAVRLWASPNPVVALLLERHCPGPITVVCKASPTGIPTALLNDTVASENRTIGVRIPDSAIEREIAGLTPYPVTTVAVRASDDSVVTTLAAAREVVDGGMAEGHFGRWCVVEGPPDVIKFGTHSTVVEVTPDGRRITLIRTGPIPFEEIQQLARSLVH